MLGVSMRTWFTRGRGGHSGRRLYAGAATAAPALFTGPIAWPTFGDLPWAEEGDEE